MKFLELAEQRYSVRKYKDTPIEPEKLNMILEAGRIAPTAKNNQPQKIYVVESTEALEKIKKYTGSHFNAPCILIICYDEKLTWFDRRIEQASIDPAIVLTHIMLQATELGIGSVWVGACDFEGLHKDFNLPGNYKPIALMPLGYPAEDSVPNPRHTIRKNLEETVQFI